LSEEEILSKKTYILILEITLGIAIVGLMLMVAGLNEWFGDTLVNNDVVYYLFTAISYLGDTLVYIIIGATLYLIYDKRFAKNLFLALLGSNYLDNSLKDIFQDPRPASNALRANATGYGFPSGHAQGSTVTYGYLAFHTQKNYAQEKWYKYIPWIFLVVIYLVAISRQIIGVHDVEDIVGGLLIGISFLLLFINLEPLITEKINTFDLPIKLIIAVAIPVILFIVALLIYPTGLGDYGRACGALTGLSVGYLIENEKIHYNPHDLDNKQRIINLAIGLAITIVLYLLLSLIPLDVQIWKFFEYLIVALVVTLLIPWLLLLIQEKLSGREKVAKVAKVAKVEKVESTE